MLDYKFKRFIFNRLSMSRNENVWTDAKCAALRVEFLTSREELFLYAKAIYSAMIWGREVNEQNRIIQEKNNSVK